MIKVIEFPDRDFETKEELFKALTEHKKELVSLKKSVTKNADAISYGYVENISKNNIDKAIASADLPNTLDVKVVINTTNFLDSHGDLHINGIWNKSVADNKTFLHLQEHNRDFSHVISDSAKGLVQSMTWKQLGLPYDGTTEALVFESTIDRLRNGFMLKQYANGWVKNHSVGMRYVNLELAINSEADYDKEYKELWDKYYPVVANKELADERGYMWIVSEAKIIEGSAVVMGSNSATPTLENKQEPLDDTLDNEAEKSLQTEKQTQLLKELLSKF
jgi:hypothetical protein